MTPEVRPEGPNGPWRAYIRGVPITDSYPTLERAQRAAQRAYDLFGPDFVGVGARRTKSKAGVYQWEHRPSGKSGTVFAKSKREARKHALAVLKQQRAQGLTVTRKDGIS